jgi:hypothetical protein
MLHDRIIRWSLPPSVGETAVNLTSAYELVRSSCGDRVWRDANVANLDRRSIKFSPELRWNGEKTGSTLTSNSAKTKELVARVGADDSAWWSARVVDSGICGSKVRAQLWHRPLAVPPAPPGASPGFGLRTLGGFHEIHSSISPVRRTDCRSASRI